MTKYVVDSWAWIEYLDGSEKGARVRDIIEKGKHEVYSCAVSLAEVVSKFARKGKDPTVGHNALSSLSKVVIVDEALAAAAGKTHAQLKQKMPGFGLADAFVVATAVKVGARVLTGDPHFHIVKGTVLI